MPLNDKSDFGMKNEQGSFCKHCITPDQKVKSCEEIFNGGVQFFMTAIPGTEKNFAERIVRKNMNNLPYWKKNKSLCLKGAIATDKEFQEILSKLG